ncbi:MAG: hypothetical protein H0T76_11410 [Nannocystis sp.]|nr:BRCT domain-containing protein [Nannocystis sp.]MBA3547082.1 hypothetical protein [Nannocystis sp.]
MQAKDLEGKNVVLTGKFATLKRAEAEVALTALGAKVSDSISRITDILFAGDKAGSKLAKAAQFNVAIHDEATLAAVLASAPAPAPRPAEPAAEAQPVVSAFAGKVVALAGRFSTMLRARAQELLTEAGATVVNGVTPTTNLVIYGDMQAERLIETAKSQGVALMDESEMLAIFRAGKAEAKPAEASVDPTEMSRVVAELRAFIQALKRRKDITVEKAVLGRKASNAKLDQLRALRVPDQLVELYAEHDGVHVEWRFTEPPGIGCMRIPAVTQWTRFTGDDSHYMNFGDEYEALLLDEITPEGSTWLVRTREKGAHAMIRFASAAEGEDGVIAANSIADYLREAMRCGFVPYWPRCFRPSGNVSYAEQELAIERFRAPPVIPDKVAVGGRVQFEPIAAGGRGQALATCEVPASIHTSYIGTKFVEVRTDEGSVAWIPRKWLKALSRSKTDAYEQLRAPELALVNDELGLGEQLDDLARALGQVTSYSTRDPIGKLPSNARRAAGLLGARPLADAVRLVLAFDHAVRRAKLDLHERRPLVKNGREFDPAELAHHQWTYNVADLLTGLHAGLVVLAHHESARRAVPGAALLDAGLVEQLAGHADAKDLHDRCTRAAPLAAPPWTYQDPDMPTLGLPAGTVVWSGTGA